MQDVHDFKKILIEWLFDNVKAPPRSLRKYIKELVFNSFMSFEKIDHPLSAVFSFAHECYDENVNLCYQKLCKLSNKYLEGTDDYNAIKFYLAQCRFALGISKISMIISDVIRLYHSLRSSVNPENFEEESSENIKLWWKNNEENFSNAKISIDEALKTFEDAQLEEYRAENLLTLITYYFFVAECFEVLLINRLIFLSKREKCFHYKDVIMPYYFRLITLCSESDNVEVYKFMGEIYGRLGLIFNQIGDFNQSIEYLKKCLVHFSKATDDLFLIRKFHYSTTLASIYQSLLKVKDAEKIYFESLEIITSVKYLEFSDDSDYEDTDDLLLYGLLCLRGFYEGTHCLLAFVEENLLDIYASLASRKYNFSTQLSNLFGLASQLFSWDLGRSGERSEDSSDKLLTNFNLLRYIFLLSDDKKELTHDEMKNFIIFLKILNLLLSEINDYFKIGIEENYDIVQDIRDAENLLKSPEFSSLQAFVSKHPSTQVAIVTELGFLRTEINNLKDQVKELTDSNYEQKKYIESLEEALELKRPLESLSEEISDVSSKRKKSDASNYLFSNLVVHLKSPVNVQNPTMEQNSNPTLDQNTLENKQSATLSPSG